MNGTQPTPPLELFLRIWCLLMLISIATRCDTAQARVDDLPIVLARICANEDSRPLRPVRDGGTAGALTEDCAAIYQVARNVAQRRKLSVLQAARSLAPHVSGLRPSRNPRHLLYGSLPAVGTDRPATWDDAKHGPWSVYAPNWTRFRVAVAQMVARGVDGPCPGEPIAWGCAADAHLAIARGLTRVVCGDRNEFWERGPRTIDARSQLR